jgi:hypothetical protein
MVVVKTAGGLTTRVPFLPVILTSLGSKSGTPSYPNRRNSQHYFDALTTNLLFVELSRNEWTQFHTSRKDSHLRLSIVQAAYKRLIMPTRNPTGDIYGLGGGVGRGLTDGATLGVGVGRGVGVSDAVAVGLAVAVAVAVGVAVGVGVGVPPPSTAAKISTRPQPYTLFGGPASPHMVEAI